jgi:hypothetical protein
MRAAIISAVAIAGCSAAAPETVGNRAGSRAPSRVIAPCPEPPARDQRETVAAIPFKDRCVVLVNEYGDAVYQRWPGAWVHRSGAGWSYTRLEEHDTKHWRGGAAIDGEVVGVLDGVVEAAGWEIVVVASGDGRRWSTRNQVRKVYYFAEIIDVSIHGAEMAITVSLDDDYGAAVAPGVYRYLSDDGGRTWRRGL